MEIGSIRMSSKGQIVIPASMRRDLDEGEQLVIIVNDGVKMHRSGGLNVLTCQPLSTYRKSMFHPLPGRRLSSFAMGRERWGGSHMRVLQKMIFYPGYQIFPPVYLPVVVPFFSTKAPSMRSLSTSGDISPVFA